MLWAVSWVVYIFGALPLGLAGFLLYWKLKPKPPRKLQKEDWKKDVVYLCQFPLVPSVRTISPFALKLETWLRMAGVKYENVYTMKFSSKGQIPYIELNGEETADSNIIITKLKQTFNVDPDKEIDARGRSLGHVVTSMLENYTAQTGFHYRYGYNMQKFLEVLQVAKYYPDAKAVRNWGRVQPYLTRFRSYLQGIGRHENHEVWEFAKQDLRSVSLLLGGNQYFLGDVPSTVDCALYGHLAQFLYIDIGFPHKECLEKECPNLVKLVERIKAEYWSDWEDIPLPSNKSE